MKEDRSKSDFAKYYEQFKQIPTLSAKEERRLLKLTKSGDQEARNTFVNANIRLVMYRVLQYCSHTDPRAMDLVSEGTLGLMRAIDLFDLSKNFRFSTYAVWWINCFIRRSLRFFKKERSVNIPALHNQYEEAVRTLRHFLGEEPSESHIMTYLGWSLQTLKMYQKFQTDSAIIGHIKDGSPNLPSDDIGPEEFIRRKDLQEELDATFKKLSPIEEDILRRYYGLGYDRQTYDQIGSFYGMTKEWVRQVETKSLRKLFILLRGPKISPELIKRGHQKEAKKKLAKYLSKLTPVEEDIVRRKHGIGYHPHSIEQIQAFYKMPMEWILEQERKAVDKLQDLVDEHTKKDPSSFEEGPESPT